MPVFAMQNPAALNQGGGATPFNPADVAGCVLNLADFAANLFQDDAFTTPAGLGDPVGGWKDPTAVANPATQATGGAKAQRTADGVTFASGDYLSPATPLVLTGEFTVYAAGVFVGPNWIPLGASSTGASVLIFGGVQVYVISDTGEAPAAPYTGSSSGLILARWRRASDNNCYFAATGMAEVLVGAVASPLTLDWIAGRGAQFTDGSFNADIAYSRDLTPGGADDLAIRAYILANWGAAL